MADPSTTDNGSPLETSSPAETWEDTVDRRLVSLEAKVDMVLERLIPSGKVTGLLITKASGLLSLMVTKGSEVAVTKTGFVLAIALMIATGGSVASIVDITATGIHIQPALDNRSNAAAVRAASEPESPTLPTAGP